MHSKITFLFFFLVFSISIVAQTPPFISRLSIQRSTEPISIDGNLTEGIWKTPGITGFYQKDPNQGQPATEKTEVWLTYDDDAIYVAAHCYDSNPDSILANLARRDYGTISDNFYLYLDPFNDKQTGFYFAITPAGQLKDGILVSDVSSDGSWDGVWEGNAKITNDGWTLEMRIPYSQLRFTEKDKYTWGINFRRDIRRKNEMAYLVYTPRNENGFVSRFPELSGLEKLNPPQRFSILPYITGKAEYLQHEPGNPFNTGSKYSPTIGVDIKYGLGTNLTLDATINPDFGQVEVDPAVVNLSDNEIYFSENRPFFIEGMSIFRFGNGGANRSSWDSSPTLFYSRRIGRSPQGSVPNNDYADIPTGANILGAGKISGRIFNDWKFGTIQAVTQRAFADIQLNNVKSEAEVEPLTYYGIARAQKDFDAGKQGLGFIATYTNRFFSDENLKSNINDNAIVGGIDGWTFFDEKKDYVLTGWLSASNITGNQTRMIQLQRSSVHYFQRPDSKLSVDSSATSLSGYAGRVFFNKQSSEGGWWGNASFMFISPGYNSNDLGYQSRANFIRWHAQYVKVWNTPNEIYRSLMIGDGVSQTFDYDGNLTSFNNGFWGSVYFANYWGADFWFDYSPSTINNRRTRGGPLTLNPASRSLDFSFYSNENKPVSFSMHYSGYSDISTFNHVGGDISIKPTTSLSISFGTCVSMLNEKAQWVGSYADATANQTYGRRYIFGNMDQTEISTNIRLDWTLTPTLSLQLYIQPLISSGSYSDLKQLERSRSLDFIKYGDGNSTITKTISSNGNITYDLDADGNGPSPKHTIGNPDFNYTSLRGNAVLRWEYLPGSTIYLVWTQSRSGFEPNGDFQFDRSFDNMMSARPDNIFMIKMTYWFGK